MEHWNAQGSIRTNVEDRESVESILFCSLRQAVRFFGRHLRYEGYPGKRGLLSDPEDNLELRNFAFCAIIPSTNVDLFRNPGYSLKTFVVVE